MRAWRALLWKEAREELPKVLVAWGICAVIFALRQNPDFNIAYSENFASLLMAAMMLFGVILGMDLVAGERSKGTLAFLLGRPLGASGVLLPKFLVGAAALFAVAVGAWLTVFIDQDGLASRGYWNAHNGRLVADLGFFNMMMLSLTPGLVIYSVVFVGSTVTDHPVKGAAVGIFIVVVLSLSLGQVHTVFPSYKQFFLFDAGFNQKGLALRIVSEPLLYGVRLAFTAGVMALCAALAVGLLRRFRGVSLEWKPVVGAWLAFILYTFLAGMFSERPAELAGFAGDLTPEDATYVDLAIVGDKGYAATDDGLATIELADPLAPAELAAVSVPLWSMSDIAVVDSMAYVLGVRKGLPEDSLGVAVFNIADPANPVFADYLILGSAAALRPYWGWERCGAGLILSGRKDDKLMLMAFSLGAGGWPEPAGELVVEEVPSREDDHNSWSRNLQMHIVDGQIWAGYSSGFVSVDGRDPRALREIARVDMGDFDFDVANGKYGPYNYSKSRLMASEGDRLYVLRHWPEELVAYDITDPAAPVEAESWAFGSFDRVDFAVVDGRVYNGGWGTVEAFRTTDYRLLESLGIWSAGDRAQGDPRKDMHLAHGHFYKLVGRSLVVFPLVAAEEGRI